MDNSERDIEDLFNDRFKEDEAPVSNRVWDNIKQNLPKNLPSPNPIKTLIKKMFFITLSVSIVSGITFLYIEKTTNQPTKKELISLDIKDKIENKKQETRNIEQEIQNRKHKTENTEQEIQNRKHKTENTEQETQNRKHKTGNTEQETQNRKHKTENTEQETQNRKHKTENTEQGTDNRKQGTRNIETEKSIKDKIENNSISSSVLNKKTIAKNKKHSDNYNSFVSEKNKNIIARNKNTIALKADTKNKKTENTSTLAHDYNDNPDTKIADQNIVSSKKKASAFTSNTNNKNVKNKDLIAQSLGKTKSTSQKETTTTTVEQKNAIGAKNKQATHSLGNDVTEKTEPADKRPTGENLNFSKETTLSTKSDNEIDFNSSKEDKKKNKLDSIEPFAVKNNLNKVVVNNSTMLPDEFSDSAFFPKNKKTETPILSKVDSNNKFTAIKENRNKNPDSTLLASTSLVSTKDSIEPDSVKQLSVADSLVSENKKQKEKKDQRILSKLSFDLLAGPGITGVSIAPNLTDSTSKNRVEDKKNNSGTKVTLSGGIRVNYSLSERFNISVGIFYSNYSQTYTLASHTGTYSTTVPDSSLVGSKQDTIGSDTSGHPILGSPYPVYNHFKSVKNISTEYPGKTVTDHYTFISLPLTASYALINKKIGIVCLGGVTTNILIKGVSHYINESFTDLVSNSTFTKVNMGVTGGLGLSYRFTKHLSFLIEPRVNYFLSNIEKSNSFIQQKPHSINVNAGLRFKF